jgi:hypothetical protein
VKKQEQNALLPRLQYITFTGFKGNDHCLYWGNRDLTCLP